MNQISCWEWFDSGILILSYRFSVLFVYYIQMDNECSCSIFNVDWQCENRRCRAMEIHSIGVQHTNTKRICISANDHLISAYYFLFFYCFPSLSHLKMCAVYLLPNRRREHCECEANANTLKRRRRRKKRKNKWFNRIQFVHTFCRRRILYTMCTWMLQ